MPAGVDETKWKKARKIAAESENAPPEGTEAHWKYVMGIYKKMGGTQKEALKDTHGEAGGGWVGVDLDGTLASYEGWRGPDVIGEPVKPMVDRVARALEAGMDVRIMTARVAPGKKDDADKAREAVKSFCMEQFGKELPITHEKDHTMLELWDDRVVQVEPNTGKKLAEGCSTELEKCSARLLGFMSGVCKEAGFLESIKTRVDDTARKATGAALKTGPGQAFLESLLDRATKIEYAPGPGGGTPGGYAPGYSRRTSYAHRLLRDRRTQEAAEKAFKNWIGQPGNKTRAMRIGSDAFRSYAGHKLEDLGGWVRENPAKAAAVGTAAVTLPYLFYKYFRRDQT